MLYSDANWTIYTKTLFSSLLRDSYGFTLAQFLFLVFLISSHCEIKKNLSISGYWRYFFLSSFKLDDG